MPEAGDPVRADPALAPLLEHDARIAKIGSRIRILSGLTWPVELEARFLERWRAGHPELPAPPTQPADHAEAIAALDIKLDAETLAALAEPYQPKAVRGGF